MILFIIRLGGTNRQSNITRPVSGQQGLCTSLLKLGDKQGVMHFIHEQGVKHVISHEQQRLVQQIDGLGPQPTVTGRNAFFTQRLRSPASSGSLRRA